MFTAVGWAPKEYCDTHSDSKILICHQISNYYQILPATGFARTNEPPEVGVCLLVDIWCFAKQNNLFRSEEIFILTPAISGKPAVGGRSRNLIKYFLNSKMERILEFWIYEELQLWNELTIK